MQKDQILKLAEEHLSDSDKFVTSISISAGNKIEVLIDGDSFVNIKDCVGLSRFIEGNLDREKEDFALEVSSHGATNALINYRQYPKHIGKVIEILKQNEEKCEGELIALNKDELTIEYKIKENKPIGKGKVLVTKSLTIPFTEIKESKIKLKF